MQVNGFAVGRVEVARGAGVVFDVTAAHGAARVDVFELGEDFF